ncbi:MAG: DUF721 domain-containing protein [Acidobacteria bacterium]|nr:DUF721 domain-containing protein [Acidobacteriota bacterium]
MKGLLASLPTVLRRIGENGQAIEPLVFASFKRSVGEAFAGQVVPVRLENDRLIVAVSTETWRRNVADLGPAIVEKLNASVGSAIVRFVDFRVDSSAVRKHRDARAKKTVSEVIAATADKQITDGLSNAADSIVDPELRERFLSAAANSLARRELDR